MSVFELSPLNNLTDNFFKGIVLILEGLIGTGKTTLGKSLEAYFIKAGIKCKFFTEYKNDDLLNMYLRDKEKYAFHFQSIMIIKRIEIYKEAMDFSKQGGLAIVDRGIMGDMAFAKMQFDNSYFTDEEYKVYKSLIKKEKLQVAHITVFLKTEPEVAFERMKNRGNEEEKKSYSLNYFQELEKAHLEVFKNNIEISVTEFDWNEEKQISYSHLNENTIRNFLNSIIRSRLDSGLYSNLFKN